MSILHETVTAYLPSKKKTTPSGWTSFNAPCCIHNGDSADKRQRGGLISNADGGISYHCFNCGYKCSWTPGRNLSFKSMSDPNVAKHKGTHRMELRWVKRISIHDFPTLDFGIDF